MSLLPRCPLCRPGARGPVCGYHEYKAKAHEYITMNPGLTDEQDVDEKVLAKERVYELVKRHGHVSVIQWAGDAMDRLDSEERERAVIERQKRRAQLIHAIVEAQAELDKLDELERTNVG